MLRIVLAAAFLATAYADCEQLEVKYQLPAPRGATVMDVSICPAENIITSSVKESEEFVGVEILEDFSVGFGASRVDAQQSCFIRKLQAKTLEEQANVLRTEGVPVAITQAVNLITIPAEDVDEFGKRIAAFCGDLPVYKIGVSDEASSSRELVSLTDVSERTISVKFIKCTLCFFFPLCILTTLFFPTGHTCPFFWFLG